VAKSVAILQASSSVGGGIDTSEKKQTEPL